MSVTIVLDDTAFEPGAVVRGHVERQAAARPEKVLVSLLWHTEGKGIEDVEIVDQREIADAGQAGRHDVSFRLPDFPWSFQGTLISLVWVIEASLEPGGDVERVTIVAAPGGEPIRL